MNTWRLSAEELHLCQLLSPIQQDLHPDPSRSYYEMARSNQVDSIIGHDYQEAGDDAHLWGASHRKVIAYMHRYISELDEVAARLAAEGIRLVALKNGGIARGIHPCPGCCPMGDLDTLVEKRNFRRAHEILLDMGFHFEFRSALEEAEVQAAEDGGGAEYWKSLPDGEKLWFELQWRPIAGRWIRPDQEPGAEELLARSIPIPGTAVRLLSPEDNLLQVCLHTAKHSYVRAPGFRLHLDVERIVRAYPGLDWYMFLERVESLQVKTAVYFSLRIPHDLFKTPVPQFVLKRLRPPAWKEWLIVHWLNRVGLFNPDEAKFSRIGYIIFTSLLYDDLRGLWRAIFPSAVWLRARYGVQSPLLYPFYYVRRLFDLALRRAET